MTFELPKLPYADNALEPVISAETISFHYGKHHQAYVTNLNNLIKGTDNESKSLEYIIKNSDGGLFNNAAQVYNHNFYWKSLTPNKGTKPNDALLTAINAKFSSLENFIKEFNQKAIGNFGSGWTWLVKKADGSVDIVNTDDAKTVLTDSSLTALFVVDVWEHAYYVDYRNARPGYLDKIWEIVNWDFANANF